MFEPTIGLQNPVLLIFRPHEFIFLLGPLHTRAKSRDHEIVGAQKKVPSQDTSKIL